MPPVKVKATKEEEVTPGEIIHVDPGTKVVIEKSKSLIAQFEESLVRLGIDLATGMHEKTRFPSTAEVAGIDALCKLYGTVKGYNGGYHGN